MGQWHMGAASSWGGLGVPSPMQGSSCREAGVCCTPARPHLCLSVLLSDAPAPRGSLGERSQTPGAGPGADGGGRLHGGQRGTRSRGPRGQAGRAPGCHGQGRGVRAGAVLGPSQAWGQPLPQVQSLPRCLWPCWSLPPAPHSVGPAPAVTRVPHAVLSQPWPAGPRHRGRMREVLGPGVWGAQGQDVFTGLLWAAVVAPQVGRGCPAGHIGPWVEPCLRWLTRLCMSYFPPPTFATPGSHMSPPSGTWAWPPTAGAARQGQTLGLGVRRLRPVILGAPAGSPSPGSGSSTCKGLCLGPRDEPGGLQKLPQAPGSGQPVVGLRHPIPVPPWPTPRIAHGCTRLEKQPPAASEWMPPIELGEPAVPGHGCVGGCQGLAPFLHLRLCAGSRGLGSARELEPGLGVLCLALPQLLGMKPALKASQGLQVRLPPSLLPRTWRLWKGHQLISCSSQMSPASPGRGGGTSRRPWVRGTTPRPRPRHLGPAGLAALKRSQS